MSKIIRAAMTETKNAGELLPGIEELNYLNTERIEAMRRANVQHNIRLVQAAARMSVKIICLGELFPAPYFAIGDGFDERWTGFAESAEDGRTITELMEATKRAAITVIAPIYESVPDGRRYNTAVILSNGKIIGKYHKMHIPHGSNERGRFFEGLYYGPSDNDLALNAEMASAKGHPLIPVFETQAGNVGVAICFDRHFEDVWRTLQEGGAELVFSPAVTFGAVSREAWKHEFPTEAVRRRLFIGGSNRKGVEFSGGPEFFGDSYFVGPDGHRLRNLSPHRDLVVAEIDFDKLKQDPSGWNLDGNRREDLRK